MSQHEARPGLAQLVEALATVPEIHPRTHPMWKVMDTFAQGEAAQIFSGSKTETQLTGIFEGLQFPFHKMGTITSLHLFGLDELILFSFYWTNRGRYKKALDLGANIGLHSILMAKCGFQVRSYEPDPQSYNVLCKNLELNRVKSVEPINAAVSTKTGTMEFVRVLDNLTGNHLVGAKSGAYGNLQTIPVKVEEFAPLLRSADFAKIDVEGHEREILLSTRREDWVATDAIVEIGTEGNAAAVYDHFREISVPLYSQKLGWGRVRTLNDMPTSYRDGSLFISCKSEMPWKK